jgi:acylphosphatase
MAKHLLISGYVQGIGFRYSMVREAHRLKVVGWVRNRRDGTVEAVVDGAADAVASIIDWARVGPPGAHVTNVAIGEADGDGTFANFESRPTV